MTEADEFRFALTMPTRLDDSSLCRRATLRVKEDKTRVDRFRMGLPKQMAQMRGRKLVKFGAELRKLIPAGAELETLFGTDSSGA